MNQRKSFGSFVRDDYVYTLVVALVALLPRLYVPIHLHYFTPRTLTSLLTAAGFRLARLRHAPVYLGRYQMSLAMKLPLTAILALGAALRMNARVEVVGVKA